MYIRGKTDKGIYAASRKAFYEIDKIGFTDIGHIAFGNSRTSMISMKALADDESQRNKTVIVSDDYTYKKAKEFGLEKVELIDEDMLDDIKNIDFAYISGAGQVDPNRYMLKGGMLKNGADRLYGTSVKLEKELTRKTRRGPFIALIGENNLKSYLGHDNYPLRIEFEPGKDKIVKEFIEHTMHVPKLAKKLAKRKGRRSQFFETKSGMHVFDVPFNGSMYENSLPLLEHELEGFEHIYATGLFALRRPDSVKVVGKDGLRNQNSILYNDLISDPISEI